MATDALPDRKYDLIVTNLIITPLTAIFVVWRIVVRFRFNPRLGLSEYLMVAGVSLNSAANITGILSAYNGQGRLDADPFLTPARRITAMQLIYASQSLNVYAMFIVKLSICAYLTPLAFRRGFRTIIWLSVLVVVLCNFLLPTIGHFGECRPIAMNWDSSVKGTCWPHSVRVGTAYAQAASNIATDLVYVASPMVYLGHIHLPRRTKLGIRIVFVLALAGTSLSVVKLWVFYKDLNLKQDFLYGAIDLSIYSVVEVSITIIVACLPPLRKTFDKVLQKILPDSIIGRASKTPSLPSFPVNEYINSTQTGTRTTFVGDSEGEERILAEEAERKYGLIVKTPTGAISDDEIPTLFGSDGQQTHT